MARKGVKTKGCMKASGEFKAQLDNRVLGRLDDRSKMILSTIYKASEKNDHKFIEIDDIPQSFLGKDIAVFQTKRKRGGNIASFIKKGILERVDGKLKFTKEGLYDVEYYFPFWKEMYFK